MASSEPRAATLGELTFRLSADELRRLGQARIVRASEELARLTIGSGPSTVRGFLEPLNRLLTEVRDLSAHGGFLFSVHPEEATRTAGREVSEAADRFFNEFRVNEAVYARLRGLEVEPDDALTHFAVWKMQREMRRAGVEKDAVSRARLLALSNEIDRVSNEYTENVANSRRSIELDGPGALAGLPEDYRLAHPPGPDGKIRVTTDYPDFRPVMAYCDDPEVRRRLLFEFTNRAYPENLPVLGRLLALRHEFAVLLGYPSYAAYALEDKMMQTPVAAASFLHRIGDLTKPAALDDLAKLLARKRQDDPTADRIENWDIGLFADGYYSTKIRTEEFGVDLKALRAYLPYGKVRDGLFELCGELFGLRFEPCRSVELWHPSVEAFDVLRGKEPIGRFYLDMAPREGKYNHAACFGVREGLQGVQLPQSALVCNFLDPSEDPRTARMEYGDVVTFFHEFGHLLHAMLSGHVRWLYNSQSLIEWDFVEAPSQLFEEWAKDPSTLGRFARNPENGEPIPVDLLERLKASEAFGRPSRWVRQVALSEASLRLYSVDPRGSDPSRVLREAFDRHAPVPLDASYHPEAAWGHLTGYSAFYYTYVWSVVIARDLLRPFEEKGTLSDPETARRYAHEILSAGSERPAAELVRAYLGRDFNFEAFENWVRATPTIVGTSRGPTSRPPGPGPEAQG
ncbi:MAG TPA: M3 family metallopeptidase [Thermoplasmata archaeon]|nr:M3 family metallopeptidase [Thermoplasmata archaeon]